MEDVKELKVTLENFATKVDSDIQNRLVSELMSRYSDVSKQLEEKNVLLSDYNNHLEELVEKKVKEISASQIATIHALVKAAESRDDDTGSHIERTAKYCRLIAEKLLEADMYKGIINESYAANIEMAAPLHDIGKIGIPDAILLKPGKLTDSEFDIMKTHAIKGYETLASIDDVYHENSFVQMGMDISKYHHEKWDGSGYMGRLSEDEIPLAARIMALSDVYDALRSKRVYKDAFTHEKSMDIISSGRGSHFDPGLVDIFLEHNEEFCAIFDTLSAVDTLEEI